MQKILIIDDSLFQRRIIGSYLKKANFEVIEAQDGKEGLEMIITKNPDLILLDLLMPGKSGFDVLKELKEANIPARVIVLTSDVQTTTRDEVLRLGAAAFVNKPVQEEELIAVIHKAMEPS
ncbi:MAG TPA: response regulator [Methanospirillum sp.]|nr:response regulator [Methanospirillum sp.]